jgi:methanogenic corrinoid protein MtbC1
MLRRAIMPYRRILLKLVWRCEPEMPRGRSFLILSREYGVRGKRFTNSDSCWLVTLTHAPGQDVATKALDWLRTVLYEIGEEWERGGLSVEAEHRFTAFSQKVLRLVEARINTARTTPIPANAILVFLMNAPGNRHELGVRILSMWLKSQGAKVRIFKDSVRPDSLMRNIATQRPRYLLISMALIEQRGDVAEIARGIQALPRDIRPRTIVGGYPVKSGLISSIPETELLSNITALQIR